MSNQERLIQASAGVFVLGSYVATTGMTAKAGRSVLPYLVLMGLHGALALRLGRQWLDPPRSDAAGNGLNRGLIWLACLASSVGFGCVTWLVFFVVRLALGETGSVGGK